MTNDELMQLKALAEAATPGPWEYDAPENMILNANTQLVAQPRSTVLGIDARNANGAFIAATNPEVILALIAKVESLAADAERLDYIQTFISRSASRGFKWDNVALKTDANIRDQIDGFILVKEKA